MTQTPRFSGIRDVSEQASTFVPALLAAALLLLAGWLLATILAWAAKRATAAVVQRLASRPALRGAIETSGASAQVPSVVAAFSFWVVFVFFVAAAMETLGLPVVTAALSRVAAYLPNVLAALAVVFVGLIAGKALGSGVSRAAGRTGMTFGAGVGATVRGTVVLVAVVVALEQVGIKADILIVIVGVVVGSALAGAGLAFGLGARTAVSNIIASHYVSQSYRVGHTVRVGDVEGKIVQTTPTAVFIAASDGRVMIPAKRFSEEASTLVTES